MPQTVFNDSTTQQPQYSPAAALTQAQPRMYALTVKFACAIGAEGWDPGGGCNAAERQRQPQNLDSQCRHRCSFRNEDVCPPLSERTDWAAPSQRRGIARLLHNTDVNHRNNHATLRTPEAPADQVSRVRTNKSELRHRTPPALRVSTTSRVTPVKPESPFTKDGSSDLLTIVLHT